MKTSKKIGIMTLSASDNCGSLLQAYALKKILEVYGCVEVINFSSESSHKLYDLPPINVLTKISFLLHLNNKKKYLRLVECKKAYAQFRYDYIKMDKTELLSGDLHSIKDKYDVVIAGSDQIWNVRMRDFDESFFLGWTNKKKIAYAPSLGGADIRMSEKFQQYICWLNEFDSLSVREETGRNSLSSLSEWAITKVLDPTLLLSENDWKQLIGVPMINGDYIFYYSWAYCYEDEVAIVKKEGKRLGLPVIVIDSRKWMRQSEKKYGFILSENEGPLAFLNLMYYAKITFVESFHGMIFSYIFRKNFWLLDIHQSLNELDSRLLELVNLLGAESRVLTKFNYHKKNMQLQMDYLSNEKLDCLRRASHEYLREALEHL